MGEENPESYLRRETRQHAAVNRSAQRNVVRAMNPESLAQLELDRYHEIAEQLLRAPNVVTLCCDGRFIARAGQVTDERLSVVERLEAVQAGWQLVDTPACFELQDESVFLFNLHDHGNSVVANLIVSQAHADGSESGADPKAIELLSPLIDCMQKELLLTDELFSMTEEITARYEELNLVYDTQDLAADFEETHAQLKVLVSNCRESMNVSFATLILRDKDLTLYDVGPDVESADVLEALQLLRGQLYDWVSASNQITVVNDVKDSLAALLCAELPYKIIAAPVLSSTNGMLIIARSTEQPNFKNNDKNLMDVMARKASKIILASYDPQTGLMKRPGFEYQINLALESAQASGATHAIFIVDIDRTQVINDTLGYEAGDMVIRALATTLQENLRSIDTISRLGGDKFGVIVDGCSIEAAKKIAKKITRSVEALDLNWGDDRIDTRISIGVTPITAHTPNVNSVIAAAEIACSSIKERGGNEVGVYSSSDEELVRRKTQMDLVARIQKTLRGDGFELYFQPIVPLKPGDDRIHGEVLLRMLSESGEIMLPAMFLPAAERYHLMPDIDRWVVGKTIAMLESSPLFASGSEMLISINLSGQTLSDSSFIQFTHDLLDQCSIPAKNLCFEITETIAITDLSEAKRFIDSFQERGVLFSLDDFGTGLSSFSYLKELPVDFLKIDGSFVKEICSDPIADTMVSAINDVGHTMKLQTIGEYVENAAIQERLREIGVDYGQGFGIAKVTPFADLLAAIQVDKRLWNLG